MMDAAGGKTQWIWGGRYGGCHVMDLGWWVRRLSCDAFGVVGQVDIM